MNKTELTRLLLGGALACLPVLCWAENHALLIGVSRYPALAEELQLLGPQHDVQLVRQVLLENRFSPGRIRILADGVPDALALPTRDNILKELKRLADKDSDVIKPGDFIYLHLAGHGSQQPTQGKGTVPEPDGLDEIFLPADVGKWDGASGKVQNAIVDKEIGEYVDQIIRDKQAFVWGVFDNCHSGTITRGGGGGKNMRERRLDWRNLIDCPKDDRACRASAESAFMESVRNKLPQRPATRGGGEIAPVGLVEKSGFASIKGGAVFFFAVQENETTPEMDVPEQNKTYGLFTQTLMKVVLANPGITYRQAGERLLQHYRALNMHEYNPLFEGRLDAPLFGQDPGEVIRQWKLSNIGTAYEISAGALHQLGEGALFAVYPHAAAKEKELIGYMQAKQVGFDRSQLLPVAMAGKPAPGGEALPVTAMARVVDPATKYALRVALPERLNETPKEPYASVLEAIRKQPPQDLLVQWVGPDQEADVRLDYAQGQIWLLPPDGRWVREGDDKSLSLASPEGDPAKLKERLIKSLRHVAKATNLSRLSLVNAGSGSRIAESLDISVHVGRMTEAGVQDEKLMSFEQMPTLTKGNALRFEFRNNYRRSLDINVFGIDSQYGIHLLYPKYDKTLGGYLNNRVKFDDTAHFPASAKPIVINDKTTGHERVVIIALEADDKTQPLVLSELQQEQISTTRDASRGASLADLFNDAGFGLSTTRGEGYLPAVSKTAIRTFNFRVKKMEQ